MYRLFRCCQVCLHRLLVRRFLLVLICHHHRDYRVCHFCLVHLVVLLVLSVPLYHYHECRHGLDRREYRLGLPILVVLRHQLDLMVLVCLASRVVVLILLCHSRLPVPFLHRGLSGRVVQRGISCIRIAVVGMVLHFPIRYCRCLSVPLVREIRPVHCLLALPEGRVGT